MLVEGEEEVNSKYSTKLIELLNQNYNANNGDYSLDSVRDHGDSYGMHTLFVRARTFCSLFHTENGWALARFMGTPNVCIHSLCRLIAM